MFWDRHYHIFTKRKPTVQRYLFRGDRPFVLRRDNKTFDLDRELPNLVLDVEFHDYNGTDGYQIVGVNGHALGLLRKLEPPHQDRYRYRAFTRDVHNDVWLLDDICEPGFEPDDDDDQWGYAHSRGSAVAKMIGYRSADMLSKKSDESEFVLA